MTLKLRKRTYEMSLEHRGKAQTEVLNEETCQKGTEVNLMDSQWPNLGQQSIKMMIAKDYNP